MWRKYEVTLNMTGRFAASLPRAREDIERMLLNRMPVKPPEGHIPIGDLVEKVIEEVGAGEGEQQFGWATFPKDKDGLYYEGRCVRGHLKDVANQVKGVVKPEIKALKAKVANRVYVMTDVIPLYNKDGLRLTEPSATEQRFIHVMTPMGERSSIKYIDYVEKPVLRFYLQVLDDGVVTDEILKTLFEYGSVHGLGQERSCGYGRYTFEIKAVD